MEEDAIDYTVYEADRQLKRKIVKPEISVAKFVCSSGQNKKLFFGAPSPLLMIEDLVCKLTLEELKDMFQDVV